MLEAGRGEQTPLDKQLSKSTSIPQLTYTLVLDYDSVYLQGSGQQSLDPGADRSSDYWKAASEEAAPLRIADHFHGTGDEYGLWSEAEEF